MLPIGTELNIWQKIFLHCLLFPAWYYQLITIDTKFDYGVTGPELSSILLMWIGLNNVEIHYEYCKPSNLIQQTDQLQVNILDISMSQF